MALLNQQIQDSADGQLTFGPVKGLPHTNKNLAAIILFKPKYDFAYTLLAKPNLHFQTLNIAFLRQWNSDQSTLYYLLGTLHYTNHQILTEKRTKLCANDRLKIKS